RPSRAQGQPKVYVITDWITAMRSSTAKSLTIRGNCWTLVLLLGACAPPALADEKPQPSTMQRFVPTSEELRAGYQRFETARQPRPRVYKDRIAPNWFHNGSRFWYRNELRGGTREFIVVDADAGKR